MRITPLLIAAAIVCAFTTNAYTQRRGGGVATLAVIVTDSGGAPLSNVLVTVQGAADRSSRTEQGRIAFEGIPAGNYRLRFDREGFIPLERELAARAGAPTDVKVTLTAAPPVKPVPCVEPPKPAAPPPVVVNPMAMDLLGFIEKNYIGREPGKTSPISCTPGGTASLIQVREPLDAPAHPDADHFLYVIAGAGAVRIGDRVEQLQSGVFTLIPRTMPHVFTAKGRSPLVVLSIKAGEKCGS
jgi:hypothetical protein